MTKFLCLMLSVFILLTSFAGCSSCQKDFNTAGINVTTENDGGTDVNTVPLPSDAQNETPAPVIQTERPSNDRTHVRHPRLGASWQWQLSGPLDTSYDVEVYDIDLFDTPASTIDALHERGIFVICYFSAGSYENWRDDMASWRPAADPWIGNSLSGWPGENWLDVRRQEVRDIMLARLDLAVRKKCDGVEPDNVDSYDNDNGLELTAADQRDYNIFLADAAHARHLSIGLKNDLSQVSELEPYFDWALNEECFNYRECSLLAPFINAGKAVFHTEYEEDLATVCPHPSTAGFSTIKKNYDLDAWVAYCP